MARFITPVNSFKAGVLSKKLYSRVDIREYPEGLSVGNNAFVGKHGGAYKRAGSQPIFQCASNYTDAQIESITLDKDTTMFVVFFDGYIQVFNRYGLPNFEPYAAISFPDGKVSGYETAIYKGDMYVTHDSGTLQPIKISFFKTDLGEGEWAVRDIETINTTSPYYSPQSSPNRDFNRRLYLTTTGLGGTTSIRSVNNWQLSGIFQVGDWVLITGISYVDGHPKIGTNWYKITGFSTTLQPDDTASVTGQGFYRGNSGNYDVMFNLRVGGTTGGLVDMQYQSTTSEEFDEWSYSLWSDIRGWPKKVSVDEGRLIFANSKENPTGLWGSEISNPNNFLDRRVPDIKGTIPWGTGTRDFKWEFPIAGDIKITDPYNFTITSKHSSEITFMKSSLNFVVGTARQEFVISGNGEVISQYNITVRPHTSHGSSGPSLVYDSTVLFATRSRQQIQLFTYSQENGSFVSREISLLNPDLLETDRVKSVNWHDELGVCYIVTDNGQLISLTLNTETQTAGFCTHDIGGLVKDISYVTDNDGDYVIAAVLREGTIFLEKIPRLINSEELTTSLESERLALNYLDNTRVFNKTESTGGQRSYITMIDTTLDYIPFDISRVVVGDAIEFTYTESRPGPQQIEDLLDTTWYVIPYDDGDKVGIRLATSYANAIAGTYQDFINPTLIFASGTMQYTLTRVNDFLPINGFAEGDELEIYSETTDGDPVVIQTATLTAQNISDGYIATAAQYDGVFYGVRYQFHIATMPIEAGQQWGTSQMGLKRIDTAMVRLYDTKSYKISSDGYNYEERVFDDYDSRRDDVKVQATPELDHAIHIQNDNPEPIYVASLALRGVSNDG